MWRLWKKKLQINSQRLTNLVCCLPSFFFGFHSLLFRLPGCVIWDWHTHRWDILRCSSVYRSSLKSRFGELLRNSSDELHLTCWLDVLLIALERASSLPLAQIDFAIDWSPWNLSLRPIFTSALLLKWILLFQGIFYLKNLKLLFPFRNDLRAYSAHSCS